MSCRCNCNNRGRCNNSDNCNSCNNCNRRGRINRGCQGANCSGQIAVRVNRIYNGCRIEDKINNNFTLSNYTPANPTLPLSYIFTGGRANMTLSSIKASPTNSCKSRLSFDYSLPLTVNYTDAANIAGSASTTLTGSVDILLTLPSTPYTVTAEGVYSSRVGSINEGVASSRGCLLIIVRIITECDVIIDTYGGVTYPDGVQTLDINCDETFNDI